LQAFSLARNTQEHAAVASTFQTSKTRKLQAFSLAIFQKFAGTARNGRGEKLQELQTILGM
jgi:hypothetical protein